MFEAFVTSLALARMPHPVLSLFINTWAPTTRSDRSDLELQRGAPVLDTPKLIPGHPIEPGSTAPSHKRARS